MSQVSPRSAQAVLIGLSGMANDPVRDPLRKWSDVTRIGAQFTYSIGACAADFDKVRTMTVEELALLAASEGHRPGR